MSFVFGLEVTWDLLSIQLEEEAEGDWVGAETVGNVSSCVHVTGPHHLHVVTDWFTCVFFSVGIDVCMLRLFGLQPRHEI